MENEKKSLKILVTRTNAPSKKIPSIPVKEKKIPYFELTINIKARVNLAYKDTDSNKNLKVVLTHLYPFHLYANILQVYPWVWICFNGFILRDNKS